METEKEIKQEIEEITDKESREEENRPKKRIKLFGKFVETSSSSSFVPPPLDDIYVNDPFYPPWCKKGRIYLETLRRGTQLEALGKEVLDFCQWISLTDEEQNARNFLFSIISTKAKALWRDCEVSMFGSTSIGLDTPESDMDIFLSRCDMTNYPSENPYFDSSPLNALCIHLQESELFDEVKLIETAKVPIISLRSKEKIKIDIASNENEATNTTLIVNKYLSESKYTKPLILLIKHFLKQAKLNEVYTGGLGSYSLYLMCIYFTKNYHSKHPNVLSNRDGLYFGDIVLSFFEFFGIIFDYKTLKIDPNDGTTKKKESSEEMESLQIVDLENPTQVVGENCFKIHEVKKAFKKAFRTLLPLSQETPTYLSRIITITPWMESRRKNKS